MVEDLDTAAIRAAYWADDQDSADLVSDHVLDLCDALDAARAELEDLRRDTHSMSGAGNMDHWCARAEAAEARIAELEKQNAYLNKMWECEIERAEAAETRIAAAVAIHDDVRLTDERCAADMYRALTGGTE